MSDYYKLVIDDTKICAGPLRKPVHVDVTTATAEEIARAQFKWTPLADPSAYLAGIAAKEAEFQAGQDTDTAVSGSTVLNAMRTKSPAEIDPPQNN